MQELKRGDIYIVNLGEGVGSIQGFMRPMIVVANPMACKHSPCIHAVPTTGQVNKKWFPTHVDVSALSTGLLRDSIALCEQVQLLPREAFCNKIGNCDCYTMDKIDDALKVQFGLTGKEIGNNTAYA